MANYFYNDERANGATDAIMLTLTLGDTVTFGARASWAAINGVVAYLSGFTQVQVYGSLYGATAIEQSQGASSRILVGAGGTVAGVTAGIDAGDGGVTLTNYGFISGATAVDLGVTGGLANHGTIAGTTYAARMELTYTFDVLNTGTISGGYGLYMYGNQPFSITNSGLISGRNYAIQVINVTSFSGVVVNTGTIDGRVGLFSDRGARLENSGTIIGNIQFGSGDDVLDSTTGQILAGLVSGGAGSDVLIGSMNANELYGGEGDDELSGMAGNDHLIGGAGVDLLDGGDGRDIARYDDLPAAVTASLSDPSINTGHAAGDVYESIEGLGGSNFADLLVGDAGNNWLNGSMGNDVLDGLAGNDVMRGGSGDDTFIVNAPRDRVIELSGQGIDTVRTNVDGYVLPAEVERLELLGPSALAASGNGLANEMIGNGAANVLNGREGADVLNGGGGADVFVIDAPVDSGIDTIVDFDVPADSIRLSRAIFTQLNGGSALQASRFVSGVAAVDAADRIIHNSASGAVFYDPDGTGAAAMVQFLQISPGVALTAADFILAP